jgi:TrmH family RNA methyltransferase
MALTSAPNCIERLILSEKLAGNEFPVFRDAAVSLRSASQKDGNAIIPAGQDSPALITVTGDVYKKLSGARTPQGVMALARMNDSPLKSICASSRGLTLVLDSVQDPGNVGTLIRTAVAFGATGVVCLNGCADPWNDKSVRSSAGAIVAIPCVKATADEWLKTTDELESVAGPREIIGTSAHTGEPIDGFQPADSTVLVIGSEAGGIRESVSARVSRWVNIPMASNVESLNASVAGALTMYMISRSMR